MHLMVFPIKMCQLFVLCSICSPEFSQIMWFILAWSFCNTSNTSISRLYAQDWRLRQQICSSSVLERRKTNNIRVHETSSCDSEGNFLPTVRKIIIWGFLWRFLTKGAQHGILLEKAQHAHRCKCVLFALEQQSVLISIVI